ncbi:MAG TPA: Clp protease ClpP [Candidatus Limivivens intestinipullorum]|uniref:ATP-dependent Clp protease proteolytic subunit n=1 Tax=Candidatus Limivivens intestinipullorum TaxID=2840858 RepID=A0A9D1JLD1_9FIRM|nr:Clp protease ClpP [Candidatus Limivivens intestinipullorum]
MKAPNSLHMDPAVDPAATATKFWNVASVSEDEGEIILYGDVMSQRPIDWWTGEPEPGLYITPEGFMEDLAAVKNKAHITVKLNSCGGDLYTGIAIHNALKTLSGNVNVVVEGIAASAASVIMCAGDTVTVYPCSLIMIHGVSVMLSDSLNIQDMKQLIKGMDASEKAVAEIYDAKTGLGVDTLRNMMTKETWMTGREALDKGFADALKEDEEEPSMSMSADRKVLYVNGVGHNVEGLHNIPGSIPIQKSAKPARRPAANMRPTNKAAKTEGGKHHMTLEELRAQEPELVSQIEQEARNAAQTQTTDAVTAERRRLADIDSIAASIPDQQLVHDAKYGDKPCTAQELCFRVMQQSAASGQQFLKNYTADGAASGAAKVGAAPNGGTPATKEEQDAADIQAVVAAYNASKGGTQK